MDELYRQVMTVQGRQGEVPFKPYRDIKSKHVKSAVLEENKDVAGSNHDENTFVTTSRTVDNLYPEMLCLIFSFLDTKSKGRTAQVFRKDALLLFQCIMCDLNFAGLQKMEEHLLHQGDLEGLGSPTFRSEPFSS